MDQKQAYERVIEIVGGVAALSEAIGIHRNAIYAWKGIIPEGQLDAVLRAARQAQRRAQKLPTKRELRPDLFTPKSRGAGRGNAKNGETRGKKESSSKTQRAEAAQEEDR